MKKIFTFQSGIYQLKTEQQINASLDKVWDYFSQPKNLDNLTPDDMAFEITSGMAEKMYAGQIISYSIEILPKIKQNWVTEISHVEERKFFVDEQRFGPYKMWHHEHHFKSLPDGKTQMNDIISYKLPMGFLGRIIAGNMIKKRVSAIFDYRAKKVAEIF